ncbi:hypothetical protein CAPTEDRAFT_223286 [Capitella teleta]|uniref:RETREG1-3/ARL6IP-like N-terminal reticulon-homology domain-containing protein n=1 Tax=Capitella teleta TaxID=283909 RepID=R7VE56_CAPTE|nr:hypothetical protein CAPTEDRAFT_223286 [Capitella teleta]|eukprot:ELU13960.1 hypothetical protein CAPTEDRAFT_223286 [Capitella teleta]
MEEKEESEFYNKVKSKENGLLRLLGPRENCIMSVQSVLVWENPKYSASILLAVSLIFWLATTLRIFYLIGVTGAVIVFLDMWFNYIWPEIRVPPSPDEDTEGWISIHPHLLSVPEICNHLATAVVSMEDFIEKACRMRKKSRAKFFILSMISLSSLAVFGCYVSGIRLLYISVLAVMLCPAAFYHHVPQKTFAFIQPYIADFEQKLNIKRKKPKKGKKGKMKGEEVPLMSSSLESASSLQESDSDEELAPFVPVDTTLDPKTANAPDVNMLSVPESDDDTTGHTPECMTPLTRSDYSDHDDLESDEGEPMAPISAFLPSVGNMPSLTSMDSAMLSLAPMVDSMPSISCADDSDIQSLLPDTEAEISEMDESADDMSFIQGHFKESSPEDEGGLLFPDIEDVTNNAETETPVNRSSVLYSPEDAQSLLQQISEAVKEESRPLSDSATSETLDEFEFLNQEDLNDSADEEK